jgi:hypothetical protein
MSGLKLIISLMSVVAVIIIGLAVFVFTHLSGINLNEGIVLIVVAVVGLFLVTFIVFLLFKRITAKK